MTYCSYGDVGNYCGYCSCPGHSTPNVMGPGNFETHLRDRYMHERYSLQPPHRYPRPIYPQPLIDHRQRPLDQPRLQNPHQHQSTAQTTSLNQLGCGSRAYQVPSDGCDHHMHAGMGCGSVMYPQSGVGIDQRPGDQLAAGICRLRTGSTPPPAVRDLHIVDDLGFCQICHVTYVFGSVDACPDGERRIRPMTDKHAEHEAVGSAADVPNVDDPVGRTTEEERKSRLQAVNETKACQEAGEAATKDTKHSDPNIILPHTDTQPNAACAEKASGSDADDGLQPPVGDLQSSSIHVRDPLGNGHFSNETLQVSKDSGAHDTVTYADYIHHVKVTERMLKAQLAAVASMSFAEYTRQVNDVQPITAMDLPLEAKPVACTDSCHTPTTSASDITPMTHAKQKTIPVMGPDPPKLCIIGRSAAADPNNPPRKITLGERIGDPRFPQPNGYKFRSSKSYAKAPVKQSTTSAHNHPFRPGSIVTPTSSEANSDFGRSTTPKPVAGEDQDSDKEAFYDSDISLPQNTNKNPFYDSDISLPQHTNKKPFYDSDTSELTKPHSSAHVTRSSKTSSPSSENGPVKNVKASKKSRALRPEDDVVGVEKGWGTWGRGGKGWKWGEGVGMGGVESKSG